MANPELSWNDIVRPYKSYFSEGDDQFSGKITLEPLSRGMGTTLGNAMRRTLLSSIESAAVTSFKITGVDQEFSSIPGVLEDVIDISMNLKALDLHLSGEPRGQKFSLVAQGPGDVFAENIQGGSTLKIVHPKQKICTITDDINLSMVISIDRGVGYTPSENMSNETFGEIFIDAHFSPIIDANYEVENISMGSDLGIERLTLSVKTNGSISPKSAIESAGEILVNQISRFCESKESQNQESVEYEGKSAEPEVTLNPILYQKIREVPLPVRCINCLEAMSILFVGDLIQKTESQLRQTPHLGEKSVSEIKSFLSSHKLSLGTLLPGWSVENETPLIQNGE